MEKRVLKENSLKEVFRKILCNCQILCSILNVKLTLDIYKEAVQATSLTQTVTRNVLLMETTSSKGQGIFLQV